MSHCRDADRKYVVKLAAKLDKAGITTWIDTSSVTYGARWVAEIEEAIVGCSAFVVVMTPAAKKSDWVNREIDLADEEGKPILPLLLDGRQFFQLRDKHYEDVTGGKMPSDRWVEQLRSHLTSPKD